MKKIKKFFPVILNKTVAFITLYMFLFTTVHYPAFAAEYNGNNVIAYNSSNLKSNQNAGRINSVDRRLAEKLGRVNDKFVKLYSSRENFKSDSNFVMGEDGKLFYLDKYGETVINYMGLTLTIPENAAPKDSYITIIPLTKEELVNIPSDVYNVTYTENGITYIGYDVRLNGSSSNKFRKNIEISFKYNDSAYKDKAIENAVFIYYFDEENYKWEKINRKSLDKNRKEVRSLTDHFCQFYAGLMSMQTEPPQAKGINTKPINIAAVDPLAGYKGVAPPKPNNRGTANVSYPIAVPEGINGMTPNVSINYSSANKDGDCGYGWNLNTSKIEIKTKNKGIPAYTDADILMLDDEELVLISSSRSAKIYRYKVEKEFCYIVLNLNPLMTYTNVYSFIVYKTDGSKLYYGIDDINGTDRIVDSTYKNKIFAWYLSKIEDKFGNIITYTYDKDNNQPFLSEIKYGFTNKTDLTTNLYTVTFTSKNRPTIDKKESYLSAFQVVKTKMLDYITVNYNITPTSSTKLVKYQLDYTNPGFGGKSILNFISENKGLNTGETEVETNKTSFTYSTLEASDPKFERDDGYSYDMNNNNLLNVFSFDSNQSLFDTNSDGYFDFHEVYTNTLVDPDDVELIVKKYINNGNGNLVERGSFSISGLANNDYFSQSDNDYFDYNNDGYADVYYGGNVAFYNGAENTYNTVWILNSGTNFFTALNLDKTSFVDFNNDGIGDMVKTTEDNNYLNVVYQKRYPDNNIDTTVNDVFSLTYDFDSSYCIFFVGFHDINGDGFKDAVFKNCIKNLSEYSLFEILVKYNKGGVFNTEYTKLLKRKTNTTLFQQSEIFENDYSTLDLQSQTEWCPEYYNFYNIQFIDVDNDGLTDIVFNPKTTSVVLDSENNTYMYFSKIYVSFNRGVESNGIIKFSNIEELLDSNTFGCNYIVSQHLDISGDGLIDALSYDTAGQPVFLINQMGNKNLLTGIKNEKTGVKTELAYDWKFLDPNRDATTNPTNYYKKEYGAVQKVNYKKDFLNNPLSLFIFI